MIEIKKEIESIKALYASSPSAKKFNAIVYGPMGSGKTRLSKTCRLPVHIDSFDPGGTLTVRDEIAAGMILADTRFEHENPKDPSVLKLWDDEYHKRKRMDYFSHIGTYIIDSATMWSSAAMNVTLKKAGRAGAFPQQNDYGPTMALLENAIKDMTANLPCDVLLLCHDDVDKDEATGRMFIGPAFIGKLKTRIPILFDEIYGAVTKETSDGTKYTLLTRATGLFKARTRLGKEGILEMYEEPNIKGILKKVGYPTEDNPHYKK